MFIAGTVSAGAEAAVGIINTTAFSGATTGCESTLTGRAGKKVTLHGA
jgi:hypothetical protein